MSHARVFLVALLVAAAGCASAAGSAGGERISRQQNVLTREEIRGTHRSNVYDVVAMLRPTWLRNRGQISIGDPEAGQVVVYLNSVQAGGADYLRQVPSSEVVSLEYLNETQASARFGLKQSGGPAIVIHTMGR